MKARPLRAEIPQIRVVCARFGPDLSFSVLCLFVPQRTRISGPGLFRHRTHLDQFPQNTDGARVSEARAPSVPPLVHVPGEFQAR